jgi:hypothetical protein
MEAATASTEYFVLMQKDTILCIHTSLINVFNWRPTIKLSLDDPLVIHRVKCLNGVFTTQLIPVNAEVFTRNSVYSPSEPFQRPYPPYEEV